MFARFSIVLAFFVAVAIASDALAKKPRPADPPADKNDRNDDKPADKSAKASDDAAATHKARAKQMENGKPLDKTKTAEGIDKITSQVNALDAALKQPADDKEPMAARGRKGRPATQPSTQPTTKQSTPAKEEDAPAPTKKKRSSN